MVDMRPTSFAFDTMPVHFDAHLKIVSVKPTEQVDLARLRRQMAFDLPASLNLSSEERPQNKGG